MSNFWNGFEKTAADFRSFFKAGPKKNYSAIKSSLPSCKACKGSPEKHKAVVGQLKKQPK